MLNGAPWRRSNMRPKTSSTEKALPGKRGSTVIAPARWRPARRTRHKHRQRKAYSACNQKRAERTILHGLRHSLRAVAERIATVCVSILRIIDGGLAGVARGILGLPIQILHCPGRLTGTALGLGLGIARHVADSAFDLTGDILC